ncbi:hypothetical protein PTE_04314 [Photorhabdus khanii NC19]|uniref:Uncharacterized protein n=1 Tax=Photorhabdus khanii NC19 TaxID=1004151 RepID=W3V429_9GAMM|nr:hypothetical protein PTE_04314 [Photorhabdus khanii NC19]
MNNCMFIQLMMIGQSKMRKIIHVDQEYIHPLLDKPDLLQLAQKTWVSRREGRGVRLVGLHVTLLDPQMDRQLLLEW